MNELTVSATLDNIVRIQPFIESELLLNDCPMKAMVQISVAVGEIFVNIARHTYHPATEDTKVRCAVGGDPLQVTIQFLDGTKPFNPLAKDDADTTLSAEERDIGDLGVLMVKKRTDQVDYEYKDGKNILTIHKNP